MSLKLGDTLDGSTYLVVMVEAVGLNPSTRYRMDIIHINCNVCLKRLKIIEKEAENGPILNKNSGFKFTSVTY